MDNTFFAPILPFDDTKLDNFCIYNQVTYTRDLSMLDEDPLKLHYPTMVKYYTYTVNEPVPVGGG